MRKVKLLFQLNGYLHGLTLGKKSSTFLFQINILRRVRTLLLLLLTNFCFAQSDTIQALNLSAYAEGYFSYDFSDPNNKEKPQFIYNHKRHNAIQVNLAFVKAQVNKKHVRGNVALMFGNYARYNLSEEPHWAQAIFEANVGVQLSQKNKIWLDAGIMPSHIGFESAIGAYCWTLTRSILAENSPYFETGLKISSLSKNEKWTLALFVLNGWQRIRGLQNGERPSLGLQISHRPNSEWILNYSNFIGAKKQVDQHSWRVFHNFYGIYEPNSKMAWTLGFDLGTDVGLDNEYGLWFSPVVIGRYTINHKNKLAARLEYYHDAHQIMVPTLSEKGFQTFGASLNYDYQLKANLLWRSEIKMYQSKEAIFYGGNGNYAFTTSLCLKI